MKKYFFKDKLQSQFETCKKHLIDYCSKKNKESLHQFRVSLKKISALLKLANYCNCDFDDKKLLEEVKVIYRQAALIRSKHVRLYELKKYFKNKNNIVLTDEASNIEVLENRFAKNAVRYQKTISDTSQKCLEKFPPISKKYVVSFLNEKEKSIHGFLIPFPPINQLHKFRKQLKQFLYVMKFSEEILSTNYNKKTEIDLLQDLIGRWHDNALLQIYITRRRLFKSMTEKNVQLLKNKNEQFIQKITMNLRELKHG